MIDQIVRRIDDNKRGILEIFNEEIVFKHGIFKRLLKYFDFPLGLTDIFIGLPNRCTNNRVALLRPTTEEDLETEKRENYEAYR